MRLRARIALPIVAIALSGCDSGGNGSPSSPPAPSPSSGAYSIGASTVTDPLAAQQWHLLNTGQTAYADFGGLAGFDINANPVYSTYGYAGAGVIVAVVDSGLEIAHEDLAANVIPGGSWNFVNNTTDPTDTVETLGDHGTSVAGLIAMARNGVGGLGVASSARLKGFNYLQSALPTSDHLIASLGGSVAQPASSDVHIFNQSFGYDLTTDTPMDTLVEDQYATGTSTLRGGRGALYLKAAGNGFVSYGMAICADANAAAVSCDNSNFDPRNAIPYQIVVGAMNANGMKSSYSTAGSSIWIAAPAGEYGMNASVSGGNGDAIRPALVTTDQTGCKKGYAATLAGTSVFDEGGAPNSACNYTNTFNGSSGATPVAAGVVALMLEANPMLTWRDVKHILALTARKIDAGHTATSLTLSNGSFVAVPAWTTNTAGRSFHNWYGFGLVDTKAAVDMARSYAAGSLGAFADTGWIASPALALAIPDNSTVGASHTLTVPPPGKVTTVEAVQIRVSATHNWNGDIAIALVSPSGTRSVLKTGRDGFDGVGLASMVLLSNAFYGERADGNWTIKLTDVAAVDAGMFTGWAIRIYGH